LPLNFSLAVNMLQLIYALKKHNNWLFPMASQPRISFERAIYVLVFPLSQVLAHEVQNFFYPMEVFQTSKVTYFSFIIYVKYNPSLIYSHHKFIKVKVHSINIWTVKIKIAVVRLVKSLVIFVLPSCYLWFFNFSNYSFV
jgi:hypothetical protein